MRRTSIIFLSAMIGVLLSGCTSFNSVPPVTTHPITNDADMVVLSTASDRRLAIINRKDNKTCMEPPPDATMNVSASLAAVLSAKVAQAGAGPEGSVSYADNLARALAHVQQPTQGIILYRNVASSLCNLYVNHAIDDKSYATLLGDALQAAISLTREELSLTQGKVGPDTRVSASETPATAASASTNSSSAGAAAKAAATATTTAAGGSVAKAEQAGAAAEKAATTAAPTNASPAQKAAAAGAAASVAVTAATKDAKLGEQAAKAAANAVLGQQKTDPATNTEELDKRIQSFRNTLEQSLKKQNEQM